MNGVKAMGIGILVLMSASPAAAAWVKVGSDGNGIDFYVDPTTIKKSGNFRRAWQLTNYTGEISEKSANHSLVGLWEYDCIEERNRVLQTTSYVGRMGTGQTNGTSSASTKWDYTVPRTVIESTMKFVCSQ